MAVTLRRMRWWDIPRVLEIEQDVLAPDAWTAEQFWSELAGVPMTRWYVVAEDGAEVVGYAGLSFAGREADVQTIAVRRSRQGSGVGSLLLDAALAEAARRDCHRVFLEVRADNAAAITLYERRGFRRIGIRRGYYADRTDAVVMRGRIEPRDR